MRGAGCYVSEGVLDEKFREALGFAAEVHGGDLRKGTEIPYVSHLLSVCALVLEDGGDEEEAIAALLHDTLEDHPEEVKREDLVERFGARVADLVEACSDTPADFEGGEKPPWAERKAAYVEQIRSEGYPLSRVALADKLHNTRCMVMDHRREGDAIWERFNAPRSDQIRLFRSLVDAFRDGGAPAHLVDEFESLVDELDGCLAGT